MDRSLVGGEIEFLVRWVVIVPSTDSTTDIMDGESVRPAVTREGIAGMRLGVGSSGFEFPPFSKTIDLIGGGVSAHLTRVVIVVATRARASVVALIRSSCMKTSSVGSPLAKQASRNLVTFEVRSMPSSRGSIHSIDPGRNLFISLMNAKEKTH